MTPFEIASIVSSGLGAITGTGSLISGGAMNRRSIRYAKYENENNRNFQAQQAELSRDWQEEMYNKYYSPSAQMASFQQAGINPAMAVGSITGNGSVSAPSASGGSSIGISQENPWQGAQSGFQLGITSAFDALRLKNESIKMEYENKLLESEAANLDADTLVKGETLTLTKNQSKHVESLIDKVNKEIDEIASRADLNNKQIEVLKEQLVSFKYDNEIKRYQVSVNNQYAELSKKLGIGIPITEQLIGYIAHSVATLVGNSVGSVFGGIFSKFFKNGKGQKSLPLPNKESGYRTKIEPQFID